MAFTVQGEFFSKSGVLPEFFTFCYWFFNRLFALSLL